MRARRRARRLGETKSRRRTAENGFGAIRLLGPTVGEWEGNHRTTILVSEQETRPEIRTRGDFCEYIGREDRAQRLAEGSRSKLYLGSFRVGLVDAVPFRSEKLGSLTVDEKANEEEEERLVFFSQRVPGSRRVTP